DIAKGRGGDHSELGARDAEEFCIQHGLSPWDTRLVSWLVRNHLTMSVTAQRKDIGDPQVIHEFAAQVDNPIRLDYLYMLTCADIRGTSPKLWNSFRDSLLKELYFATRKALRRGLRNPLAAEEHKAGIQGEARELLHKAGFDDRQIDTVWKNMGDDYFLRYSPDEIGWHTQSLVGTDDADLPLVLVRRETQRGGSEVFVYAADQVHLFAKVASILDRLGLNVLDARISTSLDGHNLESFLVLEDAGVIIDANYRAMEIVDELRRVLRDPNSEPVNVSRRQPRQHKHFPISTRIDFYPDESHNRTVLELITADRPGLLSSVAQVFSGCAVAVSDAKIATFGTRAEDIFYLTDISGNPLSTEQQMRCLREGLLEALNSRH
ncbi:MAG: ACT domain-containing protein, partial [Chromatiales bacterium]|nr:ACT domain-containing protein [Chromatiales bacterium]